MLRLYGIAKNLEFLHVTRVKLRVGRNRVLVARSRRFQKRGILWIFGILRIIGCLGGMLGHT